MIQRALAPLFKAGGYRKHGATWRRTSADAVAVFNIQGSQWGRQFYLNLGAFFRLLGTNEEPAAHLCHVRVRLCPLVPDPVLLGRLLDFDLDMPASDRCAELVDLVEKYAMPWLQAMSACASAGLYLRERPELAASMWLSDAARTLLGVTSDAGSGVAIEDRPGEGDRG